MRTAPMRFVMRWGTVMLTALGALLVGPIASRAVLRAQGAGRVSVRGTAVDAATTQSLGNVTVEFVGGGRTFSSRSDATGAFALLNVPPGRYFVTAMRVGYLPFRDSVTLGATVGQVRIELTPVTQSLLGIEVKANVTAVYGGIGSASRNRNSQGERELFAVPGAIVEVLGSGKRTVTDSLGRFFLELPKPGTYLMHASAPGLQDDIYAVVVPNKKAVEASRLLEPTDAPEPIGRQTLLREMDRRLGWRSMTSALVTGEELRAIGGQLSDALPRTKGATLRGLRIGATTCVFVDGVPKPGYSIDGVRPESVAAVELYGPNGDPTNSVASAWPKGAPCGDELRNNAPIGDPRAIARYAVIWTVP
ncbi:MAG: carboxypeptidase regulatory-like domain-containing protein [Gemmatimonadaceae bacterium]